MAVRDQHKAIEPLCRECKKSGIIKAGQMIDHLIPIRDGGEKYDHENLQTLCWSHHSEKSANEGSRFGKRG
jgi:5-methylcytosine-specific restriction protein A